MSLAPAAVGPYEVLSTLGEGGMGVVYRARHRATGELAALKTVRVHDERSVQGIRREIRTLARLRHPGIARILDEGIDHGIPYYAMEILEGTSLRAWSAPRDDEAIGATTVTRHQLSPSPRDPLRVGAAPPDSLCLDLGEQERVAGVLRIMQRLCTTLAFLHGEGVVHRDLKPENVVVTAGEHPVLIDFGLAAQFAGRLRLDLQAHEGVLGTPQYMAPELLGGRFVDARSDLYAVGCMLYRLLSGTAPFAGSVDAIVHGHLRGAPMPLDQVVPGLPPGLARLVARLLHKRPSERVGYAEDVASMLADFTDEGRRTARASTQAARPYVYQPTLTGRGAPLAALSTRLPAPGHGGSQVVLLAGEAGVGKTRLMLELVHEATDRGVIVLIGECQRETGTALEALRRPLQDVVDRCRDAGRSDALMAARVFGSRGPILAPHVPDIDLLAGQNRQSAPSMLPSERAEQRLVRAIRDTLTAFADERPLLLLLDDLQWADDLTLAFVRHLLTPEGAAGAPMLVVASYRSEEEGPGIADLLRTPGTTAIELARLDAVSIGVMVGDMLALPSAPRSLGEHLYRHSEGNPFYVAEYLRLAVSEGLLARDPFGKWILPEDSADAATPTTYQPLPLPTSLREILARRLSDLDDDASAIVTAAAVLAGDCDCALLLAMTELGDDRFHHAQSELMRRRILNEVRPGILRFEHGKLGEFGYARIDAAALPGLHARAAAAIEKECAREPDDGRREARRQEHAAALARHYRKSLQPLKAVQAMRVAAQHAMRGAAAAEATAHLQSGIALLDAMPETPETLALAVDLRIDVFGPRMMTQSVADELSFRLLLEAAPLAERFGDPLRLARVEASLAGAYFGRTDYARQLEHARRSMAWAEQTGSVANVASVAYTLAMGHFQTARLDALLELCPRVMALIDAAGPRTAMFGAPYPPYITLANVLGFGYAALGRRRDAEVMLQRGEDVANEAAHPYAITLAHVVWSWALAYFGDGERCSSHGEAALAKAIALRSPGLEMLSRSAVGMGYLFSGEIDDARDAFELALKLSHAIGYQTFQTTSHWGLAQAHLADGAFDAAIASSRAGLAFSARTGERRLDPDFHRLIAEALALGSGAYAEAEREVRAGLALARTQQAIASMPRMRVVLGGLLVRRGASQEAQAELVRARDDALAIGLPAVLRQADSELRRLAQSP